MHFALAGIPADENWIPFLCVTVVYFYNPRVPRASLPCVSLAWLLVNLKSSISREPPRTSFRATAAVLLPTVNRKVSIVNFHPGFSSMRQLYNYNYIKISIVNFHPGCSSMRQL